MEVKSEEYCISGNVDELMKDSPLDEIFILAAIELFRQGDFGAVDEKDKAKNEKAMQTGSGAVYGRYSTFSGDDVVLIRERISKKSYAIRYQKEIQKDEVVVTNILFATDPLVPLILAATGFNELRDLGHVFMSSGIIALKHESKVFTEDVELAMARFQANDWGAISKDDIRRNNRALKNSGFRDL